MNIKILIFISAGLIASFSCNQKAKENSNEKAVNFSKGSYGYDLNFLKNHLTDLIELEDSAGLSSVLLSARHQGRVMTSTSSGDSGNSYGWINYDLIKSGKLIKQFNPVGGEERFWIGPEGGQYSFYFRQGDSMDIAHWQVPGIIDTNAYDILQSGKNSAIFFKNASITNYSGTTFKFSITRQINLLDKTTIRNRIKANIPAEVQFVGYESINQVKNTGNNAWTKQKGLMSIWLLAMLTPSDQTVAIIPFLPISNSRQYITDNYFGKIPPERLIIKDSVLYFICDGKFRSKIGLSPVIAKPVAASFDFNKNILTMIFFEIDKNGLYVNSKWEMQEDPYSGDVLNSYNDGRLENGSQLGPFYELESSSAAMELKPGQVQVYRQVTCHFEGDYQTMSELVWNSLGVKLEDVKSNVQR